MKRVAQRAWALVAILALLLGGVGFFVGDYAINAPWWVSHTGSPHLSASSGMSAGSVVDRSGVTLLTMGGGTSMIGAWGLLAFVKAADTRQNASFAVRIKKGGNA